MSAHEEAVLDGLAGGWTARECADRLGVSTKSVQNARRRVLAKLDATTPVEAVRRAYELRAAGASLQRRGA
nr:helix-turn-helix transcriptional regulator [Modestobacter marinus]